MTSRGITLSVAAAAALVLVGGITTVATGAAKASHPAAATRTAVTLSAPSATPSTTAPASPTASPSAKAEPSSTAKAELSPTAKPVAKPTKNLVATTHVLTLPTTLLGLPRDKGETTKLQDQIAAAGVDFKAAAWSDGAAGGVFVIAGPGQTIAYVAKTQKSDFLSGIGHGAKSGPDITSKPGPLGGKLTCDRVTADDLPVSIESCAWSDADTSGFIATVLPLDEGDADLSDPTVILKVRAAVEKVSAPTS